MKKQTIIILVVVLVVVVGLSYYFFNKPKTVTPVKTVVPPKSNTNSTNTLIQTGITDLVNAIGGNNSSTTDNSNSDSSYTYQLNQPNTDN